MIGSVILLSFLNPTPCLIKCLGCLYEQVSRDLQLRLPKDIRSLYGRLNREMVRTVGCLPAGGLTAIHAYMVTNCFFVLWLLLLQDVRRHNSEFVATFHVG